MTDVKSGCSDGKEKNIDRIDLTGRIGARPYRVLLMSVVIRAVHQVGAAVYLTSFIIKGVAGPPRFYLIMAVVSGVLLFFTESMRHRQIYREISGLGTFGKLLLLGAAYHQILPASQTVLAAFVLASLTAHLPKDIRHRLVL